MADPSLIVIGAVLVAVGFVLALLVLILPALRGGAKLQGGGVVIIGPFPIVFGSNRQIARSLLTLAILLVVSLIAFLLLQRFLLAPS